MGLGGSSDGVGIRVGGSGLRWDFFFSVHDGVVRRAG
jgi:hypothetical protein